MWAAISEPYLLSAVSQPQKVDDTTYNYDVCGDFTMCAWVKCQPNDDQGGRLLSKRSGSAGWEFVAPRSNGLISFYGAGEHFDVGTTRVDDGSWHHVAVTYNAHNGRMEAFVDGVPDGTFTKSGVGAGCPEAQLWVGARNPEGDSPEDSFVGEFYGIMFFEFTLGQVAIQRAKAFSRAH
eukprot:TRINITY_DN3104_c0_g1_i2.p1 TRINITY_DN3104_c0_g1~~TRINITY_DN3104_c0_g1_i2.p1  ORF type:complete len:179 (-),score=30.25 TRINITY_DN3104_c0_g1_i2:378-914(-)